MGHTRPPHKGRASPSWPRREERHGDPAACRSSRLPAPRPAVSPGPVPSAPTPGERLLRWVGLALGPLLAAAIWCATDELTTPQRVVSFCAVLMAVWWMCESLPMWGTALIPFIVFPIAGIGKWYDPLAMTWNSLILLFVGGMLIARGLENTGLHGRIAVHIIQFAGGTPRRLVLGVMCAGAALSMFVSNTATALMLFPITMALIKRSAPDETQRRTVGAGVMLGLAYGCNMGGAACLIGTPPNLIFVAGYEERFGAAAPALGFLQWWMVGLPLLVVFLPVAWLYLARWVLQVPSGAGRDGASLRSELASIGAPQRRERLVAVVFATAAGAWITRGLWKPLTGIASGTLCDAIVALVSAGALFTIPWLLSPGKDGDRRTVLGASDIAKLPWGLLTLIAGGILLSDAFKSTELTKVIGGVVEEAAWMSPVLLVMATALVAVALSALTSNTGTAGVMSPVLMAAAPALGLDPRLLIMPAALGVSSDFALPVGTPPNAIAFGSGYLSIGMMARIGILMDLIAVVIVTAVTLAFAVPALGIEFGSVPTWAQTP